MANTSLFEVDEIFKRGEFLIHNSHFWRKSIRITSDISKRRADKMVAITLNVRMSAPPTTRLKERKKEYTKTPECKVTQVHTNSFNYYSYNIRKKETYNSTALAVVALTEL